MRRRTLGFGECCYHVVSRINERRFYMGTAQKERFIELLNATAYFSGVEILTYSVMDDHFHLLVRIPRPETISDEELLRRLKVLYKPREFEAYYAEYEGYQRANDEEMIHAFRQRFLRRMYNLSEFVRTLKLRFSLWFNKSNKREGPLWTGRFKSVLVQSSNDKHGTRALSLVAAYIDLNAVRAEIVEHAQDYPWCGYADAAKGHKRRLKALKFIFSRANKRCSSRNALKRYGELLANGLSSKIDSLSAGWILGQHSFVDFVTRRRPECFYTGPFDITAEVPQLPGSGLYTVRTSRFIYS